MTTAVTYHSTSRDETKGQETFSAKCQIVTILGFTVHMVSVTIAQLYCCSTKAATDSMQMNRHGCVPVELYLQKQVVGQIGCTGLSQSTSAEDTELLATVAQKNLRLLSSSLQKILSFYLLPPVYLSYYPSLVFICMQNLG